MGFITFQCTALVGKNKVGDLKPDKDGYREVVLGALEMFNSGNAIYRAETDVIKLLTDKSSELQRRIAGGNLRGEVGHPRYEKGMSEKEWFSRILDIYEPNICLHISEISLSHDTLKDKNGKPIIAIMGKVIPSGAKYEYLEKQFSNPKENVCFSIRSFTYDDTSGPYVVKYLRKVATFDNVNEGGISVASKYTSPALESYGEYRFDKSTLETIANRKTADTTVSMESMEAAKDLLTFKVWQEDKIKVYVPASFKW